MTELPGWLAWARDPEQARRVALLRQAPVFAGLPRRQLGRLCARCFEKAYATDEVVFHEGDPGKALFVVVEGAVAITQKTPAGEHVVRTLGPGACFGELALIDDFPRSATARMAAPTRLLILYKSDFDALVEGNRRIALVVLRNLIRMLALYARRGPSSASDEVPARPDGPPAGGPGSLDGGS